MLKGIIGRKTVYIVTGYTDMRKGENGDERQYIVSFAKHSLHIVK